MQIKEVERYIVKYGLNLPNRNREVVYTRAVICKMLRDKNYNHTQIGKMFNRKHDWSIHMKKLYHEVGNYSDFKRIEDRVREGLNSETFETKFFNCVTLEDFINLRETLTEL